MAESGTQVRSHEAPSIAQRIAAGDRAAESEFVAQYRDGVRTLVRRHCRPNEPMVDDLVQDVLHRVLQQLRAGELRDAAALPGYVRQAVVFTTTAEYRKRARRGEDQTAPPDTLADADDPERRATRDELTRRVRALLGELTVARDRELLRRFYIDEQDKDEVCAALAIDESHFHRVLFRARQRLRDLLVAAGVR